jgi:hypothetical protein
VSTPSAPQEADYGATPWRLQSLIIQGGGAPDVQVTLTAGGGQGLTPVVPEVGRTAPEQPGERSAVIEAAGRSEAAPESVGTKRATPEQGSSARPVKKSRVCSKMYVLILRAVVVNPSTCLLANLVLFSHRHANTTFSALRL